MTDKISKEFNSVSEQALVFFGNISLFKKSSDNELYEALTKGHYKKLGFINFESRKCPVEIFYDKASGKKRWWIGYVFEKAKENQMRSFLREFNVKTQHELTENTGFKDEWVLHWIYEHYEGDVDNHIYIGIYFEKNELNTVLEMLVSIFSKKDQLSVDENEKKLRTHIKRERKDTVGKMKKEQDDFICSICGFDFRKKYSGYKIKYAEAHHIKPLSLSDKKVKSKIDDYMTVCPNCHKIIHRRELFDKKSLIELKESYVH